MVEVELDEELIVASAALPGLKLLKKYWYPGGFKLGPSTSIMKAIVPTISA